jgi:hypothetical protein
MGINLLLHDFIIKKVSTLQKSAEKDIQQESEQRLLITKRLIESFEMC